MFSARIENTGDFQYHASASGYDFLIGEDGANAIDTLLASLSACVGHYVRDGLVEEKAAFASLLVQADADVRKDTPGLSDISVRIEVKGATLAKEQRERLLQRAQLCPIYNTLKANAPIALSIV